MPYRHFGKIGDVWKHLPLRQFLDIERPLRYIETNAAYPDYHLAGTPEQEYGILLLARNIDNSAIVRDSVYWRVLSELPENAAGVTKYLGSPRLALDILGNSAKQYVFYDIEKEPLRDIELFCQGAGLSSKVVCRNEDSIEGLFSLADTLQSDTFLFVDPYSVIEENRNQHTYLEGFSRAIRGGAKGMLWYGFDTIPQKEKLRESFSMMSTGGSSTRLTGIEMVSGYISEDPPTVNPGVLGCGILIGNLSAASRRSFERLAKEMVNLYRGATMFGDYPGDLTCESFEVRI